MEPIDYARSDIDPTWLLSLTDATVSYAQELWASGMSLPNAQTPSPSPILDGGFREEVKELVRTFVHAARNTYSLSWSCESYDTYVGGQDGTNDDFEDALKMRYPPLPDIHESRPAMIVDKYGVIVLLYAPGAIRPARQAQIFMDASDLNLTFERNRPTPGASWRLNADYFRDDTGLLLTPGLATLGFWHGQGHQRPGKKIHIAGDLGCSGVNLKQSHREAREWLSRNAALGALMSAGLAIVHPEQYALTREFLVKLSRTRTELERVLRVWPFAYTSVAAVSNRSTGKHRDRRSGDVKLLDNMTNIGGDHDVLIKFEGLGFTGRYDSGSMVLTSCHTHLHTVLPSPEAERVAFAAFVKPTVLLDMNLDLPRMPTLPLINSLHMRQIEARREP